MLCACYIFYLVCRVLGSAFHGEGTVLGIEWVEGKIHVTLYLDVRSVHKFKHPSFGGVEFEACPISGLLRM